MSYGRPYLDAGKQKGRPLRFPGIGRVVKRGWIGGNFGRCGALGGWGVGFDGGDGLERIFDIMGASSQRETGQAMLVA